MTNQKRRDEIVTLAVYEDTKEEWENAVYEDPSAESVSQLVRLAVSRYLHEQGDTGSTELSQEIQEQITEIISHQQQTVQRLDELKGQMTDVREAVVGSVIAPEVEDLAEDIFNALPSEQEARTESVFGSDLADNEVPPPALGTVEWLSDRFDAPRYQIQAALNHLQETTFAVQQTDSGQYFTEGS